MPIRLKPAEAAKLGVVTKKRSAKQQPLPPSKDAWTPFERMLADYGLKRGWFIFFKEYVFHPNREWRFDYAFPLSDKPGFRPLAIEIDGGTWRKGGGAHRGKGFLRDLEKGREAVILGWRVLRFTPQERDDGTLLETLKRIP